MEHEYAFEMATSSIRFGPGVTREVGMDLAKFKARRVMVVTDPNLAGSEGVSIALEVLRAEGIDAVLYDCVRVLTRLLQQINRLWDGIRFQSHNRRAKRRALKVLNAKNKSARIVAYKDLIKVTTKTIGYAEKTLEQLQNINTPETVDYTLELVRYISLGRRVIQQTTISQYQ